MAYTVEIVHKETGEIIQESIPVSIAHAEIIAAGMDNGLNIKYFVRISEDNTEEDGN